MTDQTKRRLYKSRTNRMIAGVCGGLAEYFGIDPVIVRVLWVLSVFLGGTGILLYIVAMIVMPSDPRLAPEGRPASNGATVWGFVLLIVGFFLLLDNLDLLPLLHWWGPFSWKLAAAIIFVVLGAALLASHFRRGSLELLNQPTSSVPPPSSQQQERRGLFRSLHDRKLLGVCGGIAEYFDVDSTIVRLLFVVVTLSSFGFGILAYILFAIIMPEQRLRTTPA